MMKVALQYGLNEEWTWSPPSSISAVFHGGPREDVEVGSTTSDCLQQPLELPPLSAAIIAGDRMTLALGTQVPGQEAIIAAIWQLLESAGIRPEDVCILQPASFLPTARQDPRTMLPPGVRDRVRWKIHDPTSGDACGYLASSAGGERIYLARELLDADFVLPISVAEFDPVLGYRGPGAVFYPGMSNTEAFTKTLGLGHSELSPESERPLRQLIDEIGWLMGVQFAIQVIPSGRRGCCSEVIVGSLEAVARRGQKLLDRDWRIRLPQRAPNILAAIPSHVGPVSWQQLGAALETCRNLVERDGRIIVLTDLQAEPGAGIEMLRRYESPRAALQPLRQAAPPDLLAATRLAAAADWASVYLLSRLEGAIVEELFCTPLQSEQEVARLLATVDACVVLGAAQSTYGEITD